MTGIVPGISFGTLAILLNIYEKTLDALSPGHIKKHLGFSIPFFIGIICGVFAFSNIITYLLTEHEMITYFAFIGLILGCAPMIYKRAHIEKIRFANIAVIAIALGLTILLAVMSNGSLENKSLDELGGLTPHMVFWLFFTGVVCAFAIIVPGMSGSIILLMLGTYNVAIESVAAFDFAILAPVGAGIAVGMVGGVKIIRTLLNKFNQMVYCAILGLVIGSVFIIFPGFEPNLKGAIAIGFAAAFAAVSYFFSRKG